MRHKTAVVTLFLVGVCIAMSPLTALAQESISEITVIVGSSGIQPPAGFERINVDLNAGSGGPFIFVCFKKGVGAPITGLYVTLGGATPPTDLGEPKYTKINVDLNSGVGGDFIYLWYTKDPDCPTIKNLAVKFNTTPIPGYTIIAVDLNRNAGGEFIYLFYEKN